MKVYKINKFAENYYRSSIRGKLLYSTDLIRRKLTRNIHLAKKLLPIGKFVNIYQYGNLLIVTRFNTIVWLHNLEGKIYFKPDQFQKRKLNELLGIKD